MGEARARAPSPNGPESARARCADSIAARSRPQPVESSGCRVDFNTRRPIDRCRCMHAKPSRLQDTQAHRSLSVHACIGPSYKRSVLGATPVTCPDPRPRVAPSHCPSDANCSPHQAVDAGSAGWLAGSSSVAIERSAAAAVDATVRAIVGAPGRAASSSRRVATRRRRVAPDEGGNQRGHSKQSEAAVRGSSPRPFEVIRSH